MLQQSWTAQVQFIAINGFERLTMRWLSMMLFGLVIALAGCSVHVPGEDVYIDVGGGHHTHGGFCPPGQAKKGNC
ncbi:hypothetical protein [Pseudomonas oryzae]|nr:hypothetical protein [Pseudomonas oryzae]